MCTGWLRIDDDSTWLNYMHHDDRAKISILKFEEFFFYLLFYSSIIQSNHDSQISCYFLVLDHKREKRCGWGISKVFFVSRLFLFSC